LIFRFIKPKQVMKKVISTIIFFVLIVVIPVKVFAQTIQISVIGGGSEVRCCTDSLVKIQITPNPNDTYTKIKVDWGDGTPILTILPGQALIIEHTYSNYKFCGMCKDYACSVNAAINGFCNQIFVFADYSNIQPENVSKILTFKVKPVASITTNPVVPCVGDMVTLKANICPSNDDDLTVKWTLPDGSMSTSLQPTYTFNQAGSFPIQLQVLESEFACGDGSANYTVNVLNKPIAALSADSGAVVVTAGTYKVCLDGGSVVVRLSAAGSLNELPPYTWSIVNPPGAAAQWYPNAAPTPTSEVVRVIINEEGTYTFKVKVDNGCNEPSEASITIQVIAAPALSLKPQRDTCTSIAYTPSPLVSGALYSINGVNQSSFPTTLNLSPNPYIIQASLSNECGMQLLRDTFFIQPAENINITSPQNTITLCAGGAPIKLSADRKGTWSGSSNQISVMNGDTIFTPNIVGDYKLVISRGFGVCKRSDTIQVKVLGGVSLVLNQPDNGCISVAYTPEPLNSAAKYTINGLLTSTFPVNLDTLNSPYSIVATLDNGCDANTKTVTLTVDKPVNVKILAPKDTVICSGSAQLQLFASDTIGKWKGPYITKINQQWFFSPDVPGSYILIFERGEGACRRADSLKIKVEPGDGVNAGPDLLLCNTINSFPLPVGMPPGGIYTGFGINTGNIDLTLLKLDSAYTYLYTINTLPEACNDDEFTLIVTAPPNGNFSLNQDTTCVGKNVIITPVINSGVSYKVNWGDGAVNNMLSHAYTNAGTYDIELTVFTTNPLTNQVLCSAVKTQSVHIITPIDINNIKFTMSPDSGCSVLTVMFTNESQAENGKYGWNFGNGQSFVGYAPPPVQFVQGIEDTTYFVTLTVNNGCDSIVFTKSVKVFPQPKAKMGLSYLQPCSGGVLKASVLSTGNPENNIFYTTTGLTQMANLSAPSYFQFFTDSIPLNVGIYLVTTNFCGTDTTFETITVAPTDVVAVIGLPDTTAICIGSPLTLINYATTGAMIDWTVSNGNTYVGDTISIIFDSVGLFYITLKAFGCGFDSMQVPITVYPLPTISVEHTLNQCPHLPLDFVVTSNASNIKVWYGDGDSTLQKISQHYFKNSGIYLPIARAVSAKGCIANWNGELVVLSPPIAMATGADSVCVGEPVSFSGLSDQLGTCSWTFGDGTFSDNCNPNYTFNSSGLFSTIFNAISPEGCLGYDTILIYVRSKPSAEFTYFVKEKCTPAKVEFKSNTIGATGINWRLGDGSQSILPQFEHVYNIGQKWLVTLIATNEGICSDTTTQNITVFQTPIFDLDLEEKCTVDSGFNLIIHTPLNNFVKVTSNGYDSTGDFHAALPENDYFIYIKTPEGCENDTTIVVLPVLELNLSIAQDSFHILLGDSVQFDIDVNKNGVLFDWSPRAYLDDYNDQNPTAKPFNPINYIVVATDDRGCTKSDIIVVEVTKDRDSSLFIPNAFSPNGDGNNDVFYVRNERNPSIIGIIQFEIYDKWGEKVFDVHNLDDGKKAVPENPYFGWDGDFRGKKAEAGTYRYQIAILYVDNFPRTFEGSLILIR
jgi:gliding motility-associated-like protein